MIRVETNGSIWTINEGGLLYLRLPKEEKPRERSEWGGVNAGPMQDAVWHPFIKWWVGDDGARTERHNPCLFIEVEPGGPGHTITAPNAVVTT